MGTGRGNRRIRPRAALPDRAGHGRGHGRLDGVDGQRHRHGAAHARAAEGSYCAGRFTRSNPARAADGRCDGALLARIHRYTVNRYARRDSNRQPGDFMRFLFKWQHVDPSDRLTGLDGLRETITLTLLDGSNWWRGMGAPASSESGRLRAVDARSSLPDGRNRLGAHTVASAGRTDRTAAGGGG
jgi:ATP-dependent Lhr-like helicase